MTAIQIVLLVFAAFALSRAALRFRRGLSSARQLAGWVLLWLAVIAVVLLPETTNLIARYLGVGRGADVVIYLGMAGILYLLFRTFAKLDDLDRQITRLVRAAALREFDESQRKR